MGMSKQDEYRKPGRPATGVTPKRYFRMDDDDWQLVKNAAEARGETMSDFIRRVILNAAKRTRAYREAD